MRKRIKGADIVNKVQRLHDGEANEEPTPGKEVGPARTRLHAKVGNGGRTVPANAERRV